MSTIVNIISPTATLLYDSEDPQLAVQKLNINEELNAVGTAQIALPWIHLRRSDAESIIVPYRSIAEIRRGDELLFRGRATLPSMDFYKTLTYTFESEFAFFCDTVVAPGTYTGTLAAIFTALIVNHTVQTDVEKTFGVGTVDVTTEEEAPALEIKEPCSTAAALTALVDKYGGYIRFSTVNGDRVVNWSKYALINAQPVRFGANLLDLTRGYSQQELVTRVYAYGKAVDGVRITLPAPGYIQDADAVAEYGIIGRTVTFNDAEDQTTLAAKAAEYLAEHKSPVSSFSIKAVDLSATGRGWDSEIVDTSTWHVGGSLNVESAPHGISGSWLLVSRSYDLLNGTNDKLTLGARPTTISGLIIQEAL